MVGTAGPDVSCALGGDDVVYGLDGDDVVYGDAGNDVIYGGPGDDVLNGGGGSDEIWGKEGDDVIDAGGSSDTSANTVGGGEGNDVITGSAGNDVLYTGPGVRDTMYGLAGDDRLTGYDTTAGPLDELMLEPKVLYGGEGNDRFYSNGGEIDAKLGSGDDVVYGSSGNDEIEEGEGSTGGSDWIVTGGGNDSVTLLGGDTGADYVALGSGTDTLVGAGNGSTVYGGDGEDLILIEVGDTEGVRAYAGAGDDHVEANFAGGGSGRDTVYGSVEAWAEDGEADHSVGGGTCYIDADLDLNTADCAVIR
ncbi:MAG: calcium-binding protein [Acidimicrobiales bacterium]